MITIGADPELFLTNRQGKFISAVGKFGGTKKRPKRMSNELFDFFVQEDNVAVEFNIPPVDITNGLAFQRNIELALAHLHLMARGQELELAIVPSAEFPKDQLRSRASRVFGCDPDFNVWAMRPNPSPKCDNPCLRSAGGHIHFGGEFKDKIALGRAADLFIGCPSIVYDSDVKRRSLYGKAGAVRDKPYGLEYRTVSNFWLKGHMNMVRQQAIQATEFEGDIPIEDGKKIMACINETNMDCLKELTVKYGLRY